MSRLMPSARSFLMASASGLACVLAAAGVASADPAGSRDSGSTVTPGTSTTLGEVVVTAQKRSQSIQTVGMAITAETGAELKAKGVTDVTGLTKIDPSFAIQQGNFGGVVYQIRGVGYNDFSLAASPTVSVYSDEVPYAYPDMSKGATFDLERVEILKGPQGTLYGQNATGGAINYIAAKPTNSLEAGIETTYASFNAVNYNGFISGPLNDTLKARLSFDIDEGGAWQKAQTFDQTLGNKDNKFGRLILDWRPTDKLKVLVNLNTWTDNSDTQAAQLEGIWLGSTAKASYVPVETSAPLAPQNAQAANWYEALRPVNNEHYYQGSVRAEYTFSDSLLLTYLGSYEHYTQADIQEPGGVNAPFYLDQKGTVSSDSQELRLSGKLFDNKLNWLLGADYAETQTDEDQLEDTHGTTSAYSLTAFAPGGVGLNPIENVSTDRTVSEAVFTNLEFHPTSQLELHAGARFTQTDIDHGGCSKDAGDGIAAASFTGYESHLKGGVGVVTIAPGGCFTMNTTSLTHPTYIPGYFTNSLDQNNVSWTLGANWTPIAHTMFYATVSQGYKAGSFPTLAATFSTQLLPVTQESVLAYETGVKSRFLDNRVELDGDVFYYDYLNKQLEMREPEGIFGALNTLVNVPRSEVTGAEVALKVIPVEHLTLSFHGTYLDTDVTKAYEGFSPLYGALVDGINIQGESFPNTPKWALNGDAEYDWDLNDKFSAYIGIDARYQSQSQGMFGAYAESVGVATYPPGGVPASIGPAIPVAPNFGNVTMVNKAYALADLRVGLVSRDQHWRFQVFANNFTNTYYWNQARLAGDAVIRFAGMPATYGVTIGYKY